MKKIKKNDLKLDREVISSLSENELTSVKGGTMVTGYMTEPGKECWVMSMNVACKQTEYNCKTKDPNQCIIKVSDGNICIISNNNGCLMSDGNGCDSNNTKNTNCFEFHTKSCD